MIRTNHDFIDETHREIFLIVNRILNTMAGQNDNKIAWCISKYFYEDYYKEALSKLGYEIEFDAKKLKGIISGISLGPYKLKSGTVESLVQTIISTKPVTIKIVWKEDD